MRTLIRLCAAKLRAFLHITTDTHQGANLTFALQLHHLQDLPVAHELESELEWRLQLRKELRAIERKFWHDLDRVVDRYIAYIDPPVSGPILHGA